jgi:flagellar hook-associated protein 2
MQVEAMSSTSAVNSLASGTTPSTPTYSISDILAASSGSSTAGIDVTAAVAAAIYADRAPERVWQADQTTFSSQTTALTAIQTATQAVQTDMESLNTLTGSPLSARTVASSNSAYLTATATDGTTIGDHSVTINSLAATGSWYSDLETSPTATLPTSSITINMAGGGSTTIQTGSGNAGDTLNDLAIAINTATTGSGASLGVNATVISDSTGSRLAIVANSPGAAADFSVSEPYTSWTAPQMTSGETLGANSLTLTGATAGAGTATIATTTGETYAQLATAINSALDSNGDPLGITASATTDGSGDTNLTLTSTDGTTPFTINEPSATTGSFGFTQAVAGANASLTVDGVPISSASNTVTGAIPGVTLNLLGATSGSPVALAVQSDASQVSTAVNQFVTDYNSVIGLINAQYTVSSTTSSSGTTTNAEGILATDPTLTGLQSALEQAVNYAYTPPTGTTTTVSSLNDLGITANNDGTLTVDSTTLDNALSNNPNDVQNFFEGTALDGFASSVNAALNTYTEPATGAFTVDLNSISSENTNITSEISDFETNYIASQQTSLTAEYSSAEEALQALPEEMQQLNSELGFNNNSSNG